MVMEISDANLKERIPEKWNLNHEQIKAIFEEEKLQADRLRAANRADRKGLYAEVYDAYFKKLPFHPQFTIKQDDAKRKSRVDNQLAYISPFINRDSVFMEIGAGDCSVTTAVSQSCKRAIALEVSKDITANIKLPTNAEILIFDGFDIPLAENTVDLAFSNQLMEHLHPEDAIDQLKSIYKVLKPGGVYICITPNGINGPHDISRFFTDELVGFHLKEYTATELKQLFISLGFKKSGAFVVLKGYKVHIPWFIISKLEQYLKRKSKPDRIKALKKPILNRIFNCVVYAQK